MIKFFKFLIKLAVVVLVIAAIAEELRKPRGQRDWYGRVGGLVPYEFRPPTPSRVRNTYWNPDDERVFTEPAFGVGWGVNLARVREIAGRQAA